MQGSFTTRSTAQTEAIGAELAASLDAGDVVLIDGELGAGKTTLVRGAARALGVKTPVTSPTFTIGHRYPAPVSVAHLDLYRITDLGAEDPDLLADYLGADTIAFVEWAGQSESLISGFASVAARVSLEHLGGDLRAVEVSLAVPGA